DAAAIAFGHLHFPYRRRVGRTLIADVASAGIPRDGDLRPAYGLFTFTPKGWRVQIRRVRYQVRKATQAITARHVPGGPLLIHKLVEARYRHHAALQEAARRHSGLPPIAPPPGTRPHGLPDINAPLLPPPPGLRGLMAPPMDTDLAMESAVVAARAAAATAQAMKEANNMPAIEAPEAPELPDLEQPDGPAADEPGDHDDDGEPSEDPDASIGDPSTGTGS